MDSVHRGELSSPMASNSWNPIKKEGDSSFPPVRSVVRYFTNTCKDRVCGMESSKVGIAGKGNKVSLEENSGKCRMCDNK